jgi:hypothetical protein
MPAHSHSQNGVAELVIGPATSGRIRWLAYGGHPRLLMLRKIKTWMAGTSPAMTDYSIPSNSTPMRGSYRL